MPDMSPLERIVRDELVRAGEGHESLAVARSWRAMTVGAVAEAMSGREHGSLSVLGVTVSAAELYGYTLLNESLSQGEASVRFSGQAVTEIMMYLRWCESFFSHLGMIAAVLPTPTASGVNVEAVARANAAILQNMISELSDTSKQVEESVRQHHAEGCPEAIGIISITTGTFQALARALGSVVCAWLTPEERNRFNGAVKCGAAELAELQDLVHMFAEESDDCENEGQAPEGSSPDEAETKK